MIAVLSFNHAELGAIARTTELHVADTPVRAYPNSMEPIAKTITDCVRRTVV